MRNKKCFYITFLCLASLMALPIMNQQPTIVNAQTEEERSSNGLSFSSDVVYKTSKALSSIPKTFEAYVSLPSGYNARPGIIFGNHENNSIAAYSFELFYDATTGINPRLFYDIDGDYTPVSIVFDSVDLKNNTGTNFHLAITHDTTVYTDTDSSQYTLVSCYVNGTLAQTKRNIVTTDILNNFSNFNYTTQAQCVGGDNRAGNGQYFKGNIKNIRLYSDVRTEEEVADDYENCLNTPSKDTTLLAAYDLTQAGRKHLLDLSGNGHFLKPSTDSTAGLTFDSTNKYILKKKFEELPHTFEASLYLPTSYTARGGIILGSYGTDKSLNFEINTNGNPRLYFSQENSTDPFNVVFSTVDIRSSSFVHLAITHDVANNQIVCYLNGSKVATHTTCAPFSESIKDQEFMFGGDFRSGNEQYFKGEIKSLTTYSDVRTDSEILSDYQNGINFSTDNLLTHYSVCASDATYEITDLTFNGYDIKYSKPWFTHTGPSIDYDYSFAVVGDTQIVNNRSPEHIDTIYDWIISQRVSKNIKYCLGLGDITDSDSDAEWTNAKAAIYQMNGLIPYSLVRGNHDTSAKMNKYFYESSYINQLDGFYEEGKMDNAYALFEVGETKYLNLCLDYGASDDTLTWASGIIETYHDRRVIINTHAYMFRDGTTLDANDVYPPSLDHDNDKTRSGNYNTGDQMWDKLVSKHGNIFLVLSGHDPCDDVVTLQSIGQHGNVVTQMLIDPQGMDASMGATGMVAMFYFSKDGTQMEVEFYSTVRGLHYKESNQFILDISGTGDSAHTFGDYEHNDTHHWQECTCEACSISESYGIHNWNTGELIQEATPDQNGIKLYTCITCGKTREQIIPYEGDPDTSQPSSSSLESTSQTTSQSSSQEYANVVNNDSVITIVAIVGGAVVLIIIALLVMKIGK